MKLLQFLFFLFFLIRCSLSPAQNRTVLANPHIPDFWGIYGWKGSPEDIENGSPNADQGEWFYIMSTGEVKSENMKAASKSLRNFLCGRDALQSGKTVFHKRIAESEKIEESLAVERMRQTESFNYGIKECRPLGESPEFVNCDCNIYIHIPGGRKIFK